jgi:hypothetical protein
MNTAEWLNGTFILSLTGMVGGGCSYLLIFFLKSRCTNVECCCIKCQRSVLESGDIHRVSVSGTVDVETPL